MIFQDIQKSLNSKADLPETYCPLFELLHAHLSLDCHSRLPLVFLAFLPIRPHPCRDRPPHPFAPPVHGFLMDPTVILTVSTDCFDSVRLLGKLLTVDIRCLGHPGRCTRFMPTVLRP